MHQMTAISMAHAGKPDMVFKIPPYALNAKGADEKARIVTGGVESR